MGNWPLTHLVPSSGYYSSRTRAEGVQKGGAADPVPTVQTISGDTFGVNNPGTPTIVNNMINNDIITLVS